MEGIYNNYQKYGVDNYYKNYSNTYKNPHEEKIVEIYLKYITQMINEKNKILDIACGEGLITKLINKYNNNYSVIGTDPYFTNSYCQYNYSFQDIALGKITNEYDIAICCYAYHLLERSWQHSFLNALSEIVDTFIILSPGKKIKFNHLKWKLVKECRENKITLLIYKRII